MYFTLVSNDPWSTAGQSQSYTKIIVHVRSHSKINGQNHQQTFLFFLMQGLEGSKSTHRILGSRKDSQRKIQTRNLHAVNHQSKVLLDSKTQNVEKPQICKLFLADLRKHKKRHSSLVNRLFDFKLQFNLLQHKLTDSRRRYFFTSQSEL